MLTPQEVSTHSFSKASFGGYNMAMVDEFLDELTDDYTALYKENAALKARIAAIPDDWYYFSTATIRDMMRFYKGFYPNFSTERYEKLREVFELDEKRPIRRFSKGMQKQAAFWLAMCLRPDVLVLDEPTSYLDIRYQIDLPEFFLQPTEDFFPFRPFPLFPK